ncbi:MAG: hypothetical protein AAB225_05540 [Acidobacteriota bacterium]
MKTVPGLLLIPAALALASAPAFAQTMISAKSGMIHYVEGKVLLDGKAVEPKFGQFPQIKENGVLRTEAGRAEVLLSPGVVLRLSENGGLRLITDRLIDTRLELLSGSILVECGEILKGNAITIAYKDAAVSVREDGLYRIDTEPAELRVYGGRAVVESAGQVLTVKGGRTLTLDGTLIAGKFDSKLGDSLFRWSKRRADTIAMANLSSAKTLRDSDTAWRYSNWVWNPYFGLFTFIPHRGIWSSPYGCRYYSPREVYIVYYQPVRPAMTGWDSTPRYNSNLGYSTISQTPSGSSGTMASSAPPTTASGSQSAPIARESGSAGGRGR